MTTNDSDTPPFDKKFTRFDEENRAGLAVMAIQDGKTLFKKGYGLSNLQTQERVDCDTNFRMASVSKQFTAMAIAILEENQKLSIDEKIGNYLPKLPKYMKDITIKHLVHHLSGLPDYSDALWSTDKNKPLVSNNDIYQYYQSKNKLDKKPGEKHEYSNGGYSLLALIIENAAGESYPEFMQQRIFKPADMPNTAIITYPSTIKKQAISYSDWPYFEDIDYNTGNALYGEDGVYTSLNDMQGWINAIENNVLVSRAMTKKLFSKVRTNGGKKVNYGYGWGIGKYQQHKVVHHNGSWVGFNTAVAGLRKKQLWLVAFSNTLAISSDSAMRQMAKHYLDIKSG